MRRVYIGSVAVIALAVASLVVPRFFATGNAQEKKNALPPDQTAKGKIQPVSVPASKIAKSKIDKVTVYPNSALVSREVEVPEGTGLVELVVKPMPHQIVPSTMYSEAGDGLRVLTTRYRTFQVFENTDQERRTLDAEKEKLLVNAAKINSEMATIHNNMQLLSKLEGVTQKTDRTGDEIISVAKYVMEQRAEKAKQLVDVMEQKRLNDIKIAFVDRKIGELGAGSGTEERECVITVDREAGQGGKIRLNYLVGAVAWRPEYKLRAGKVTEDVQLDYLANLTQSSGEDWGQVKLILSTAQPMLNASPPELCMLEPILVQRGRPGGPPMPTGGPAPFAPEITMKVLQDKADALRSQAAGNYRSGKDKEQKQAEKQLNDAAAWEQNNDLMRSPAEVLAQAKKKLVDNPLASDGPSVTYHLPNKLTIPNRNDEQVIEVVKLKLTPKYYYKAVPVLNRHVYRLADLANKGSHILLPGEATMYQGTDFVGRMPMPLVAIGEEFTAGFGVDTQLQIQRQMVDQTRSTQGGNQLLKYEYRILISSYKSEPVQLQLWDRLPKGETESVGIQLLKCSPELSKDGIYVRESRPNNLLRWDVEVPANCNGEKAFPVTYEFRMELDRQMAITGFQSR